MPATAAHYCFGQDVYKALPVQHRQLARKHKAMFDLGLQGPDILFYYSPLKDIPLANYGHELHKKPVADFLILAADAVRVSASDAARAYLYGFVTHFILDSTCHPSIEKWAPESREHIALETELDRSVLRNKGFAKPERVRRQRMLPDLGKVDFDALGIVYSELDISVLHTALKNQVFFGSMLYSPTGVVKKLMGKAEESVLKRSPIFAELLITKQEQPMWHENVQELRLMFPKAMAEAVQSIKALEETIQTQRPLPDRFDRTF